MAKRALHQFLRRDVEIKDRVRLQGDAVEVLQPGLVHAAHHVARHERVDVTVGQDNKAGFQRRQDDVLELVGKIRGVEQAERGAAQDVALLRLLQFLAHEAWSA